MPNTQFLQDYQGLSLKEVLVRALKATPEDAGIFSLTGSDAPIRWVYRPHDDTDYYNGLMRHHHLVITTTTTEEAEAAKALLQPFEDQWKAQGHDNIRILCTEGEGKQYYSIVTNGLNHETAPNAPFKELVTLAHTQFQADNKTGSRKKAGPRHKGFQAVTDYLASMAKQGDNIPKDERGMPLIALLAMSADNYRKDTVTSITTQCYTEKFVYAQLAALKKFITDTPDLSREGGFLSDKDRGMAPGAMSLGPQGFQELHRFLYESLGIGTSADPNIRKSITIKSDTGKLDSAVHIIYAPEAYNGFTATNQEKLDYPELKEKFFQLGKQAMPKELLPRLFLVMPLDKFLYRAKEFEYTSSMKSHDEALTAQHKGELDSTQELYLQYFGEILKEETEKFVKVKKRHDYPRSNSGLSTRLDRELLEAVAQEDKHLSALSGYDTSKKLSTEVVLDDSDIEFLPSDDGEKSPRGRTMEREPHTSSRAESQERSWGDKVKAEKTSRSSSQSPTRY